MKWPRFIQERIDALHSVTESGLESIEMKMALHEVGWLGASGKSAADDIRKLAEAWAAAEWRAARTEMT